MHDGILTDILASSFPQKIIIEIFESDFCFFFLFSLCGAIITGT